MLEKWIQLKYNRPRRSIIAKCSAVGLYKSISGPKNAFAKLTLEAAPSTAFAFSSEAEWSTDNCDDAVLEGILDEILCDGYGDIALNTEFILRDIIWHPVDSSPEAFYNATRKAVRDILMDDFKKRFELQTEANKNGDHVGSP